MEPEPIEHKFRDVLGSNEYPRNYQGRCTCGFVTDLLEDKDAVWDQLIEHFINTPAWTTFITAYQGQPNDRPAPHPDHPSMVGRSLPTRGGTQLGEGTYRAWIIGSHPSCDWVVQDDPYISPRHAVLTVREDDYFMADLGSSNGTYILRKGARDIVAVLRITHPQRMLPGDQIRIGRTILELPPPGAPDE